MSDIITKLEDRVNRLEESLSFWKKECALVTASCNRAEEKIKELEAIRDWYCGCDHWNGPNLPFCAQCGRKPGER